MSIAGCFTPACTFYIEFWLAVYAALTFLCLAYGLWITFHGHFLRSRSPHIATAACVGLFALDRLVEYILRQKTNIFVSVRDSDRALAMIIDFVVPSVLMVMEFTLVLSLWLGAINSKFHDPAQRVRLRCRIVLFNALQISATSALGLLNLAGDAAVPSRATLSAATNITFSVINIALVFSFVLFGLGLRRLLLRLGPTQSLLRSPVAAVRWRATRDIIAQFYRAAFLLSLCLATYTAILISDAAYLFRHHTFRGSGQGRDTSYTYTNPFPVLHLYRAAEALPAFTLLALLAFIARRRRAVRVAEVLADAQPLPPPPPRVRAHGQRHGQRHGQQHGRNQADAAVPYGSLQRPAVTGDDDNAAGMYTELTESVTHSGSSVLPTSMADSGQAWTTAPPPSSTLAATNGSDRTDTVAGAVGAVPAEWDAPQGGGGSGWTVPAVPGVEVENGRHERFGSGP